MSFQNSTIANDYSSAIAYLTTDGTNYILSETNKGIFYTTSSSLSSWQPSNLTSSTYNYIVIKDTMSYACSSSAGLGLYYSADYGATWTKSSAAGTSTLRCSYILPLTSSIILAFSNENKGIWRSTDSGVGWTQILSSGNFSYAASSFDGSNYRIIACTSSGGAGLTGVYRSPDGGVIWTASVSGDWTASGGSGALGNNYNYACVVMNSQYAITCSVSANGIWYSSNYGVSWTQATSTTHSTILTTAFQSIDIQNQYVIATGSLSGGTWSSSDYGVTWTRTTANQRTSVIFNLNSTFSGYCYAYNNNSGASAAYVLYSTNYGSTWATLIGGGASNSTGSTSAFCSFGNTLVVGRNAAPRLKYSTDNGSNLTIGYKNTASYYSIGVNNTNMILGTDTAMFYSSNSGVSWTTSNITSGNGIYNSCFMATNAVCGTASTKIFYSTNNGITWNASTFATTPVTTNFNLMYFDGSNGIASSSTTTNAAIWFSTDSGVNWTISNYTASIFTDLIIKGSIAITCSYGTTYKGFHYSTDGGQNFAASNITSVNANNSVINNAGTIAVGGTATTIYYSTSTPLGQTWTAATTLSPTTGWVIYGFNNNSGSESIVVAGSTANGGIKYSTDSGVNWTSSNITTGKYEVGFVSGYQVLAASNTVASPVYYSNDNGVTFTMTNITSNIITKIVGTNTSSIAGYSVLIGNMTSTKYSTTVPCFNENTTILNSNNEYVSIKSLKINDVIHTYKDGLKKIKYIQSFKTTNNNLNSLQSMFKMKNTNFIVSGGHSILVDELTKEEHDLQKISFGFDNKIHDKQFLLACISDKFEIIKDNDIYVLYHIVLENDDIYKQYGIYANDGILTETISEDYYLNCLNKIV
jgi:hypothetical protein